MENIIVVVDLGWIQEPENLAIPLPLLRFYPYPVFLA